MKCLKRRFVVKMNRSAAYAIAEEAEKRLFVPHPCFNTLSSGGPSGTGRPSIITASGGSYQIAIGILLKFCVLET